MLDRDRHEVQRAGKSSAHGQRVRAARILVDSPQQSAHPRRTVQRRMGQRFSGRLEPRSTSTSATCVPKWTTASTTSSFRPYGASATPSRTRRAVTQSLRWRIASWYAALLIVVIALVSLFLVTQLHGSFSTKRGRAVDRAGSDIAPTPDNRRLVRSAKRCRPIRSWRRPAKPGALVFADSVHRTRQCRRLPDRKERQHGLRDVRREAARSPKTCRCTPRSKHRSAKCSFAPSAWNTSTARSCSSARRAAGSLSPDPQPDLVGDGAGARAGDAGHRCRIVRRRVARDAPINGLTQAVVRSAWTS